MKTALLLLFALAPLGTAHADPQLSNDPIEHRDHFAPDPDVHALPLLEVALPSQDASTPQHFLMVDPAAAAFVLDELTGQAAIGVGRAHDGALSNGRAVLDLTSTCPTGDPTDLPRQVHVKSALVSTNPGPGGPVGSVVTERRAFGISSGADRYSTRAPRRHALQTEDGIHESHDSARGCPDLTAR